jgi:DNA-binding transcriptional MerR regulator
LNVDVSTAPQLAATGSTNQLTVEQLAAETGMSVRNIRAHQARGLLAPPEVRLRVGYYGPEHIAQLRLIRELQDEGFNLGGIKRLIDDTGGTAERLIGFRRALAALGDGEPHETLTLAELARRFRVSADEAPALLGRAVELGVLVPAGPDRYEVPSPSLLTLAEEVTEHGVSMPSTLDALDEIIRHCDSVSRSLVEVFLSEVWKPFQQADMPPERWPEIEQAVERLRPIASEALMAIFQQRLGTQVEAALVEITRRLANQTP